MRHVLLYCALLVFSACKTGESTQALNQIDSTVLTASLPTKFKAFFGPYHAARGTVYEAEGMAAGTDAQEAFQFGEYAILSRPSYGGYTFQEAIESRCFTHDVNRIWGMVVPPSEAGVVNNPADTELWVPAASPGMIQGAERYSKLSKLCPQIAGMIIDDFIANYRSGRVTLSDVIKIRDALKGKTTDNKGNVTYTSPDLKLAIVVYERELADLDAELLKQIEAVNLWIYNQNGRYQNFESYINTIRTKYPEEEIIPGIYILNSDYGVSSRASVHDMLDISINLYDQGLASGILLFAGHWVTQENLSQFASRGWPNSWNDQQLAKKLNTVYYPYLGQLKGRFVSRSINDGSETPIAKAIVKIYWVKDGHERLITRKFTKDDGSFEAGVWAGRNPESPWTYRIDVEQDGVKVASTSITSQAQTIVEIPDLTVESP